MQERVEAALAESLGAHGLNQVAGACLDPLSPLMGKVETIEQGVNAGALVAAKMLAHGRARRTGVALWGVEHKGHGRSAACVKPSLLGPAAAYSAAA